MSGHVAPHRWADADDGKLHEREVARMELHAEGCAACARARDRVRASRESFEGIQQRSAPALNWDEVRARIHWSVAHDRRQGETRSRGRRVLVPVLGLGALGAAIAFAVIPDRDHAMEPTSPPAVPATAAVEAPAPKPVTELSAIVVRELGEPSMPRGFDGVIGKGAVIATGDGAVDVQFDEHSGIAIGPRSTMTVQRFDSEHIELVLAAGTVDITVSRRPANQRFTVRAGERTIEVRGTQFRVRHEESNKTRVACVHGKVAVRDSVGEVEVSAERVVELAPTATTVRTIPGELSVAERAQLANAAPMTLPVWTSASQLVLTSSALEVATVGRRDVRVDGVEVGQGPVRVRVLPGRHTVEAADAAGRFRRSGWVDVAAGKPARIDVHPEAATPTPGANVRKKQLHAALDRARLAACTRALAKSGVTDAFVTVELAVDETGAVGFLNVIDTDLPSMTAGCVREVLADVRFKAGPAATFREKLDL